MYSDYSKPSGDVAPETARELEVESRRRAEQSRLIRGLRNAPGREFCIVCKGRLDGVDRFCHRRVPYVRCPVCGHIQTGVRPPPGYPHAQGNGIRFDEIYPKLDVCAYRSRRDRIYLPKLLWALGRLADSGLARERMLESSWLELGSGAGYFLAALRTARARRIAGLEENEALAQAANEFLGEEVTRVYRGSLSSAVREHSADVYVAFFVLEHIEDAHELWEALGDQPAGTVFLFSVPTFGFATLLESACKAHAARSLDSVVHTQLYTDASILYALDLAGYETLAEWIFGQDAIDLKRLITHGLLRAYPESMLHELTLRLAEVTDPLQAVLDRGRLADARHVVAIKR